MNNLKIILYIIKNSNIKIDHLINKLIIYVYFIKNNKNLIYKKIYK